MLVIALPFIISQAAMPFGIAVSLRFLERPTSSEAPKYTIPAQGDKASVESDKPVELTSESLTKWTQLKDGKLAQGYANSVIPLDLLYLLLLGAFLGVASTTLVGLIQWPAILPRFPVSAFWLLPALYILFDCAEDITIIVLLKSPTTIKEMLWVLTAFRTAKLLAVFVGFVQVFLLCGLSFLWPTTRVKPLRAHP
jgi:hypothetical protein